MVGDSTCRARRKDGTACQSRILLPSGLCHLHDPDRQATVQAARVQGGRNKATSRRLDRLVPATIKPALALLFTALEETHNGTLDARQASAMAAVASAIVRMYQVGTLEERLTAVEQAQTAHGIAQ